MADYPDLNILKNIQFFRFDKVNSTNDFLLNKDNSDKVQVCITLEQTKGKGQFGRDWLAPKNSAILCSVKRKFSKEVVLNGLSLTVGLAIIKTLEDEFSISNLKIKWPNDIYYNDKKLAGILLENRFQNTHYMVIGFGLNTNFPKNFQPQISWIDLHQILRKVIDNDILTIKIIQQILRYCTIFEKKGFEYFLGIWDKYDYLKGKTRTIKNQTGMVQGVAKDGALILKSKTQQKLTICY